MSLPPSINHVKGHQDDTANYHDLPLPTQLNCDADALATCELLEYPTLYKHVPLLPAAKVQLSLGRQTVTHNLPAIMHYQHGLSILKPYLRQQFRWRNDTIESVHWDAFLNVF
jgi:hypothetical protein